MEAVLPSGSLTLFWIAAGRRARGDRDGEIVPADYRLAYHVDVRGVEIVLGTSEVEGRIRPVRRPDELAVDHVDQVDVAGGIAPRLAGC